MTARVKHAAMLRSGGCTPITRHGHVPWLALVTLLVACTSSSTPRAADSASPRSEVPVVTAPQAPRRITAAIRGFPRSVSVTIDAAGAGSTAGIREVEQLVNSGLAIVDGEGTLRPQLVEAVPSVENGLWKVLPDGRMETTWKLRPNAQWHDGTPVTADDLVFTTGVAQDRSLAILLQPMFDFIERVEATDLQTLVVYWKQPFINANTLFSAVSSSSVLPMPRHVLGKPYSEDKESFVQLRYWGPEFVGSGPFKLRTFEADSHLVLTANDRYLHGRPKIDEIEVRFVGDFNVMVANVLAGAVDITLGRGLSLEQGIQARDQWRDGRMDTVLTNITALFPQFLNPTPAVVADVQFRRALVHAIDRQQLSDSLQAGLSPVAHSPLPPTDPEGRETESSVVRYEYDPRRASQILEGLGYSRGSDGALRDGAGQRLEVKIQTTNDDLREKMLPTIGDYWQQVGVRTEPVIIPRQLSNDRRLRSEFASFDFTRQPNEPVRYHSSQAPLAENNYRGNNRTRYRNPELDGLIDRYLTTILRSERVQIMSQIVHHMTDQLVIMGIFFIVEPALISNRLVNVTSRKVDDALHTWNAHEWELK